MGLDQYAYKATDVEDEASWVEIQYWRKHYRLQQFMYRAASLGPGMEMDAELLDELEEAVKNDSLPKTSTYGDDDDLVKMEEGYADFKPIDIAFIKKARQALDEGKVVFYEDVP